MFHSHAQHKYPGTGTGSRRQAIQPDQGWTARSADGGRRSVCGASSTYAVPCGTRGGRSGRGNGPAHRGLECGVFPTYGPSHSIQSETASIGGPSRRPPPPCKRPHLRTSGRTHAGKVAGRFGYFAGTATGVNVRKPLSRGPGSGALRVSPPRQ